MGNADLQRQVVGFDDLTLERGQRAAYYFDFDGARDALQEQAVNRTTTSCRGTGEVRDLVARLRNERHAGLSWLGYGGHWRLKGLNSIRKPCTPHIAECAVLRKTWARDRLALQDLHRGRAPCRTGAQALPALFPPERTGCYDRADQLRAEDKSGSGRSRLKHFKAQMQINDPAYTPDTSDMKLVVLYSRDLCMCQSRKPQRKGKERWPRGATPCRR